MSQGRRGEKPELHFHPQLGEHSVSTSYAQAERGPGRKPSRQGTRAQAAHADAMGTVQQLSNSLRRGETPEQPGGRDALTRNGVGIRQSRAYAVGGPPMSQPQGVRPSSRPTSSAIGSLSPRQQHTTSYRDAALIAAQHGLSAYAQSAAATARNPVSSRSGGCSTGLNSSHGGRPPPPPRGTQHSAPTPNPYQPLGSERLPSRSGLSASPGGLPPSRASQLPSRGSAPVPSSPSAFHRTSDAATAITITYNDLAWRGAFGGSAQHHEHDDVMPSSLATAQSLTTPSASRGMSPGWGAASASAYEADGRPGTRGGGPQFDIDGRPTTRGGQRPPSRVQLGLAPPRPPSHVAPLGGGFGLPTVFAGGLGQDASPTSTVSGAAGATATVSASGEGCDYCGGSLRRPPLPLPPAMSATSSCGAGSRSGGGAAGPEGGCGIGIGGVGGGSSSSFSAALGGPGFLSCLGSATAGALHPTHASHFHSLSHPGQEGHSCFDSGSVVGGGATPGPRLLVAKLSSIAEVPGSPVAGSPVAQAASGKAGAGGRLEGVGGRKSSRERLSSAADGVEASPDGTSEEGINDDSYLSNLDQNGSNRCGSGRTRSRRSTAGDSSNNNGNNNRQSSGGSRLGAAVGPVLLGSPAIRETPVAASLR